MGKSAVQWTTDLAKQGDLIRGKGKGDMNSGMQVRDTINQLIGAGIALMAVGVVSYCISAFKRDRY